MDLISLVFEDRFYHTITELLARIAAAYQAPKAMFTEQICDIAACRVLGASGLFRKAFNNGYVESNMKGIMIRPCVKKTPTIRITAINHSHSIAWYNVRAFSRFSSTDNVRR